MDLGHRWNHVNYSVPPERLETVEHCIDLLFPWTKFVAKPYLLGYRLGDDLHSAALYFRPLPAAAALFAAVERLRASDPALGAALDQLEHVEGDWVDHAGFMTESVAAWEQRLAHVRRIADEHPEFGVAVVDVLRPGDGRAATDYLYQAFIRIGLLGPLRNTFEMQARSDVGA
jgi:hypothetical protein